MNETEIGISRSLWFIDSCGWLDFFGSSKRAISYKPFIESAKPDTHFTSSIVLFEVYKREYLSGFVKEAKEAIDHIRHYCSMVNLTNELAVEAAIISSQEHLAMADSIILASARRVSATLLTSDADLKGKNGVRYID